MAKKKDDNGLDEEREPLVSEDGKTAQPIDRVISVGSLPRMKDLDIDTLKKVNVNVQDQMTRLVFGIVQNQENILTMSKQITLLNKRMDEMQKQVLRLSELQKKKLPFTVKLGLALGEYLNKDGNKEKSEK